MPCYWPRSESTLVQVMPCCLTAPSHHLNRCWLLLIAVLLGLLEADKLVDENGNFEESEIFYTVQELFLVVCDSFIANWPFVLCRPLGHRCILSYVWEMFTLCMCYCVCGWFGVLYLLYSCIFCIHLQSYHRITDHGSTWSYFNGLICHYIFLGPRI